MRKLTTRKVFNLIALFAILFFIVMLIPVR
jgi:hypothetical protein